MAKVISIVNQKGGVGKTTTTINLGSALALNNKKILIVDFDQQANATITLGINREDVQKDIVDFLLEDDTNTYIMKTDDNYLDLIPASLKIANFEQLIQNVEEKELLLSRKLATLKEQYDYILIDCPPALGIIIDNALFASDSVIIPVECSFYAYDALTQMINKIDEIQKVKPIEIEGILLTKLDNRNTIGYNIVEKVKFEFPFKTCYSIFVQFSRI